MKRYLLVPMIIMIIVGLVMVGCAAPAPAPAPKPSPAPAPAPAPTSAPAPAPKPAPVPSPAPAPKQEVIKLRYSAQDPPGSWEDKHAAQAWVKMMEDATGGKVKFDMYLGQTLNKGVDAWEAVKSGITDIGWSFFGYWPGVTELADVVTLPFLPFTSAEQASGVLWKLYEKYPAIQSQFKDNQMLLLWSSTPYFMQTTKKQIKTMDDMKGLKIRVPGGPPTEMIKLLGGSPMMVGMPDTYLNMQKGVMDGMANNFSSIITFRHYEVAKYYTYVPLFTVYFGQAVNKDSWNRLPKDIQEQILSAGGALKGSMFWGKNMFDSSVTEGPQIIKQAGYEMSEYTIPQAEVEKWTNVAGKPLWDAWVKKMEGKGYKEAKEILTATQDLIKTTK